MTFCMKDEKEGTIHVEIPREASFIQVFWGRTRDTFTETISTYYQTTKILQAFNVRKVFLQAY